MKNIIYRKDFKNILEQINEYDKKLIHDYENFKKPVKKKGYLIKKKSLDELKDKLKYNSIKKYIFTDQFAKYFCSIKYEKISLDYINVEIFNSFKELMKNLKGNNEYIIVNNQIANILSNEFNEDEALINYEINSKNLILYLKSKEKLSFKHNLNIININSFCEIYIGIENLYDSILEYYNFEKLIIKELKDDNKQNIEEGYLIDENCFDEWKKYSNYDKIKKNVILEFDDLSDNNMDKIKDYIDNKFTKNKVKIKTLSVNDSNSLINILKNKTLILISEKFVLSLISSDFKQINNKIRFSLNNKNITFYFDNSNFENDKYIIPSYNNIISLNMKIIFNNINSLIKIYFFQKKIKKMLKKEHGQIDNIKLIDKKYIQKIKELYNYDNLIDFIKDLEINNINEDNDNYYLLNEIPESYFDDIYNKFYLNNDYNNNELNKKNLYHLEKKMLNKNIFYLDNFELIDLTIFDNLICPFKDKISKDATFFSEKNNLLIKYQIEKSVNTYCVGYFNKDNSFTSKYLILSINNIIDNSKILERKGINYLLNNLKTNKYGYYDIYDIIGYCFDVQSKSEKVLNIIELDDLDENINNNNENKNELSSSIKEESINYNKNENELSSSIKEENVNHNENQKELPSLIKEEILKIIYIYLFNYDLKNNIMSTDKIITNKCYIINKEWISTYKKYYLYDELSNYLNSNNYIEKLNLQKNEDGNIFKKKNKIIIYNDIKEKSKFFNLYYQKDIKQIDKNLLELKKIKIENLTYINEFIILNKKLYTVF